MRPAPLRLSKLPALMAATVALSALAGCLQTDGERAIAGAAGGALVSDALGGSALTGAVVGGAAGYFCDELNVPGCRNR